MKYQSKSAGLLSVENVKDGEIIKIVENPYESFSEAKQQTYLNCKVEIADGTHKLASIDGNFGADRFSEMWGDDTEKWVGHSAKVEIRTSKAGNPYIVLIPIAGEADKTLADKPLTDEQKAGIQAARGRELAGRDCGATLGRHTGRTAVG